MIKAVFHSIHNSEYNNFSGKTVDIIRPLTSEEADLDSFGPMFKIRLEEDEDMTEYTVFADELYPIKEDEISGITKELDTAFDKTEGIFGYRLLRSYSPKKKFSESELMDLSWSKEKLINEGLSEVRLICKFEPSLDPACYYIETFKFKNGRIAEDTREKVNCKVALKERI